MAKGSSGYLRASWLSTPYQPYVLSGGLHLFSDLRFIDPGQPSYVDEAGNVIPYTKTDHAGELYLRPVNVPRGIRVVAEQARKSDPLEGPVGWTVLFEDGLYRSWMGANYSESKDGFVWTKPSLPNEQGVEDRNTLFFSRTGVHGPGVFIDPSAPAAEKYKMVFWSEVGGSMQDDLFGKYFEARPDDYDPFLEARGSIDAIFVAVSPDGIQWKLIDQPLVAAIGDNPNVCYYDTQINKYVLYTRVSGGHGRRCIGRAESDDFHSFPVPDLALWADLNYLPSNDFYSNAHSLYPGTADHHFIFPTVYNHGNDASWVDIYTSHDGIHWSHLPGGPVMEGHPDTGDEGFLISLGGQLVPLSGDRVGLHVRGSRFTHDHVKHGTEAHSMRYALWTTGRLACVRAEEEGFFATPVLKFKGRQLKLNFRTPVSGQIRVEVVGITSWVRKRKEEQVIAGRTFADCDPLFGDQLSHTVTWRGQPDLGHAHDQPVYFRFNLRYAKLYSFEIV